MSWVDTFKQAKEEILSNRKESSLAFREQSETFSDFLLVDGQYDINDLNDRRAIHIEKAARLYRERGWVQIWSGHLKCSLYLVRDRRVKVPNPAILQYTEKEVRALKGLTLAAIITLHEAKVLFNGAVGEGENGGD